MMDNLTLSPLLPQVLMEKILLTLPVKSLLRFKCVCKLWRSHISSPQFAKLHYDRAAAPTCRLLIRGTGDHVESIDPDATPLSDDSADVCLPFPLPPPNPLRSRVCLQFFGSCRGFLLLNHQVNEVDHLMVWNPSTGNHKLIPGTNFVKRRALLIGFGYDASKDDYLVFFIIPPRRIIHDGERQAMIKLFSLKTNSWDCIYIDFSCIHLRTHNDSLSWTLVNEAFHWLVEYNSNVVIFAFDLVERRSYEIPLPQVLSHELQYWLRGLRVIGGCLGVWCINSQDQGEMWMMKEYGVLSSWSRYFRFGDNSIDFLPICLTRDNALLVTKFHSKKLQKLCGKTDQWLSEHFTYGDGGYIPIHCLHCSVYRESLLSLPTD